MSNKRVLVARYDAVGGPNVDVPYLDPSNHRVERTKAGRYRVLRCTQHESRMYPGFSTFRWGSPVETVGDRVYVLHHGEWIDSASTGATASVIRDRHSALYGKEHLIAPEWIYNDFGHVTCYYYTDQNGNGHQDPGEKRRPDFIHPTPDGEAHLILREHYDLPESHGCIHVRPPDIDQMIERGYLARNNVVVVHEYTAENPYKTTQFGKGGPPYEVHFYPKAHHLCVLGKPHP